MGRVKCLVFVFFLSGCVTNTKEPKKQRASCTKVSASFKDAKLRFANFQNANLSCADFRGADLRDVNFYGADLFQALYNHRTKFSRKFNPLRRGMLYKK